MVGCRWSASRSFLLAAARLRGLHLDSSGAASGLAAMRKDVEKWSSAGGSAGCSSRSQKQVSDLLDRFAESEPFAGPVVEFGGDLVQLGLGMHREVAALGEVLPQ